MHLDPSLSFLVVVIIIFCNLWSHPTSVVFFCDAHGQSLSLAAPKYMRLGDAQSFPLAAPEHTDAFISHFCFKLTQTAHQLSVKLANI